MKKPSKAKRAWWLACVTDTICGTCEAAPAVKFPGWQSSACMGCWRKDAEREAQWCASRRAP